MPVLSNAKHERFAQELAQGKSADEAYVLAGYSEHRSNAARLSANEHVRRRVEEILSKAAAKAGATVERVLGELVRVGFSDIRKVVRWTEGQVTLIPSDEIDDDTAAFISEISQTKDGMKVKVHSKMDALGKLGQHLMMFKERVEHTGPNGGAIETKDVSSLDRAKALASLVAVLKAGA